MLDSFDRIFTVENVLNNYFKNNFLNNVFNIT